MSNQNRIVCQLVAKSTQKIDGKVKYVRGGIVVDGTFLPMNVVQFVINNTVFYTKGSILGEIESTEEKNGFTVYHLVGGIIVTVVAEDSTYVVMPKAQAPVVDEEESEDEEEEEDEDSEDEDSDEEEEEESDEEEDDSEEEDEEESEDDEFEEESDEEEDEDSEESEDEDEEEDDEEYDEDEEEEDEEDEESSDDDDEFDL